MLTEKYRPRSISEYVGHKPTVDSFLKWMKEWKPGKAVILHGPPGVGKTSLVHAFASENGLDLIETNASDLRSSKELKDTISSAVSQKSLVKRGKIFLFDEIQNIPGWERFVRRLHDQGYKFIVTGSNASLLSQELGTRLTGRSIRVELLPFSFQEYLRFKKTKAPSSKVLTTKQKGQLRKHANDYLLFGGIPDALKYKQLEIHKTLYDDVLYRDIATRYKLDNTKNLKELSFYLISNISNLISFNKLKQLLKLGSVNTIKSYIDYLENSWLFFVLNK